MTVDYTVIQRVWLNESILPQTYSWLRESGRMGNEAFVLWAGVFQGVNDFLVITAIYPRQNAFRTASGIGVHIDGDELFRIGHWLYDNKQTLLAQVHSHPTEAYHSDTDDRFPMVTAVGQFSVVVPNFASDPKPDLSTCAIYRLDQQAQWLPFTPLQVQATFREAT